MYMVYFEVEYYDEGIGMRSERGFFNATTFTQAMERIENYYGECIESVKIQMYDSPFVIVSSDEVAKEIIDMM